MRCGPFTSRSHGRRQRSSFASLWALTSRRALANDEWEAATVVALWYREVDWPVQLVAPYQMKLAGGDLIFAPVDSINFVIADNAQPPPFGKVDKAMLLATAASQICASGRRVGKGHFTCVA